MSDYTDTGDYPKTIPGLRKLVTKLDASLHRILLQRDELLAACKLAREVLKAKGGPTANERNHAYLTLGWAIDRVDSSSVALAKDEGRAS